MKASMTPFSLGTTLLITVLLIVFNASVGSMAYADVKAQIDEQSIGSIGKEEEKNAIKEDLANKQRATSLAKQYETTAKLIASQGGDPKPLLDAAAYFAKQAK
jgi:hypothetical protein